MSLGSIIGGVVGGVIGWIYGGPYGAYFGFSLGFSLGMYVDPMTPDIPSTGGPDQGLLVMSGEVGTPIIDLAGTAKVAGHLLCYGGERADPVYTEVSGGKGGGGSDSQVTGYKYYMSWAVGIIAGQADTLYTVYKNDDVVWAGELDCPASGGEETIVLTDMGSATFYFGTDDHILNSKVGALLDDPALNVPYRNLCWCFFDDCFIGSYNRAPTMRFVLKKIPEYAFSDKHEIQSYDCNPAHVMWYILHDLTGLPESWLHSTDFATIASTLWGESRGLSVLFSSQQSALNYLESVSAHVDGILRYGIDGKFHPKLIRDDYEVGDLSTINEDVMLEEPTFNRKSWIDTLNEMKVQYSEIIDVEREKPFGALYGWGDNIGNAAHDRGKFGIDTVGFNPNPLQVDSDGTKTISSSAGQEFSARILSNGILQTTGENSSGQLGLGDTVDRLNFTSVDSNTWKKVYCGLKTLFALRSDGSLYGTGDNSYGQLGLGDTDVRTSLTFIMNDVLDISVWSEHAMLIKTDTSLWIAGRNTNHQLGLDTDTTDRHIFVNGDGAAISYGTGWTSIAAGGFHSFGVKGGVLWVTGLDWNGQLGLAGANADIFTQISSGWDNIATSYDTTIGVKTDGTMWGTGDYFYGQLGLGSTGARSTFIQIGSDTDWERAEPSIYHSLAVKAGNTLWSCGNNSSGQLGLGDYDQRTSFTQISGIWKDFSCSFMSGGFSLGLKKS